MTISEQEDLLFEQWRKSRRPNLVRDGLADEKAYLNSSPRVILILKEVNSKSGGWDLRNVLRDGKRSQTWNSVTRWMRGIRQLDRTLTWSEVRPKPSLAERQRALQSIGVINLKKDPGGSSANKSAVEHYATQDADLIRTQLSLYAPDLIICGGVGPTFASVIGNVTWKRTKRGVRYFETETGHAIDYYHPQVRYPRAMLYYTLIDAVRELRGAGAVESPPDGGSLAS